MPLSARKVGLPQSPVATLLAGTRPLCRGPATELGSGCLVARAGVGSGPARWARPGPGAIPLVSGRRAPDAHAEPDSEPSRARRWSDSMHGVSHECALQVASGLQLC
jgi:hypothetical protein